MRTFIVSLILLISLPLFADWHFDVKHGCIIKIAVERNVVTLFVSSTISASTLRQIIPRCNPIHFEDEDHERIDHHGLGIHGDHVAHYHLAFEGIRFLPPDVFNNILIQLDFDPTEGRRIMQDYAQYFENEREHLLTLQPLRGAPALLIDAGFPRTRFDADAQLVIQAVRYSLRAAMLFGLVWYGSKIWPSN